MIYDIRQVTTYHYASSVAYARHVLRLTPIDRMGQRVHAAAVDIEPAPVERREGHDFFGNRMMRARRQSMGGNGLIVSFGEVMPMRRGRLQRQSRRAFWASAAPEVPTSELAGWCWARQTLIEKRAPSRW
jgi:hypothetical protein